MDVYTSVSETSVCIVGKGTRCNETVESTAACPPYSWKSESGIEAELKPGHKIAFPRTALFARRCAAFDFGAGAKGSSKQAK